MSERVDVVEVVPCIRSREWCLRLHGHLVLIESKRTCERLARNLRKAIRAAAARDAQPGVDPCRASLEEILDYSGGADHALDDPYVMERARDALDATAPAARQDAGMVADAAGELDGFIEWLCAERYHVCFHPSGDHIHGCLRPLDTPQGVLARFRSRAAPITPPGGTP